MEKQWLVVGVSGATCSGKTTLAKELVAAFPGCVYINQDRYFFPVMSPRHTWVEALNHVNWEIMSALDMDQMQSDIKSILSQNPLSVVLPEKALTASADCVNNLNSQEGVQFSNVLIIEGFLLFNDPVIFHLCDLRYYLVLTKEQCWDRRKPRIYDPPDVPGYFDMVVWPMYVKHRDAVLSQNCINIIDGMNPTQEILSNVLIDMRKALPKKGPAQ